MNKPCKRLLCRAAQACAMLVTSFGFPCMAQQSLQVLHDHVRPAVSNGQAAQVGHMPPTQQMRLTIVLPLRNEAELDGQLNQLYDSSSPYYGKFLSVAQFTEQFSPTAEDYQAVVDFVKVSGFTVTDTPENRLIVPIVGSVEQIEKTFNLSMNVYQHPKENRTFYSPDREPSLSLSIPVAHISGLDNFVIPQPAVAKAPVENSTSIVPASGSGPSGQYLGSDMRAAYYGGTALTGNGQTVGLLEYAGYNLSDVNLTFSSAGQSYSVPINNVVLDGVSSGPSGSDVEEVLDIVQAISMAPGLSQVRVYIGSSDVDIFNKMATENIAKQISISWVWANNASADDSIFKEFAAQGQSIFAASGDWGSYPVSEGTFPAEDAWVTAVGGTDLTTSAPGGSWVSETAWSASGGGASPDGIGIPNWQSGLNGANGASTTLRNIPDVSAEANYDNYTCYIGTCAGGWGGTSFAAPRWAGFMALVNQQAVANGKTTLGGLNLITASTNILYTLAESSSYSSYFHDITSGSNGTHSAGTGYDLVTGWGSPNGQNLINALISGQSSSPTCTATPQCFGSGNYAAAVVSLSCTSATQLSTSATICGLYGSGGCTTSNGPSGSLTSSQASASGEAYSGATCSLNWCYLGTCYQKSMTP